MKLNPWLALVLAIAVGAVAQAAFSRDGATIENSGSTNTAPYSLKVWSNGNAAFVTRAGVARAFSVPISVTARFFRDVQAARSNPGTAGHCMKSASFGTSTYVLWHGWRSFDLSCLPRGAQFALAADVRAIQSASGVTSNPPRRIPLMPGELRRAPSIPSASPTPAPKEHSVMRLRLGL